MHIVATKTSQEQVNLFLTEGSSSFFVSVLGPSGAVPNMKFHFLFTMFLLWEMYYSTALDFMVLQHCFALFELSQSGRRQPRETWVNHETTHKQGNLRGKLLVQAGLEPTSIRYILVKESCFWNMEGRLVNIITCFSIREVFFVDTVP